MARVPEGLAREALEWLADEGNIVVDDGFGNELCILCVSVIPDESHDTDCLHTRSAEWLAAEKAAREWRPRAVEICPVHDYTLPCPSCDMAAGVVS